MARAAWAVVALALCAGSARQAAAFVCSRALDSNNQETLVSLAWKARRVPVSFSRAGTAQLSAQDTNQALRDSITVWEQVQMRPTQTCFAAPTDLTMPVDPDLTDQDFAGYNFLVPQANRNVLMFRDTGWIHGLEGPDVIALTTTTYNAQTGELYDADVEFNSMSVQFSVGDVNVLTDLRNTAVHEIGHMLGFGHSADEIASMFANAPPHDTLKRLLSCDDADLMNMRYPVGQPTGYCTGAVDASCGFCAAPTAVTSTAAVRLAGTNDGLGGCRAAGGGGVWVGVGGAVGGWARWARGRARRRLRRRGWWLGSR